MTRPVFALAAALLWGLPAYPQKVQIGVLGLFHPHHLTLSAGSGETVVVSAGGKRFALEPGTPTGAVDIRLSGNSMLLDFGGEILQATEMHAGSREGAPAALVLKIPGKIQRAYRGTLAVKVAGGALVPMVTMDLEAAVAAVVAAEFATDAPLEALKAQAVVTRSYFAAGSGRHNDYDFCDLTHCQLLREAPGPESAPAAAAMATRGLVLTFQEKPFAAMFTRSCGGRTRTPAELGMTVSRYPYFGVACDYCLAHPWRWSRRISDEDARRLLGKGEAGRLALDRYRGWNAIPSNNFEARAEDGEVILEGAGQGHGIGLCQRGAKAAAEKGASFREILSHYFPNSALANLQSPSVH